MCVNEPEAVSEVMVMGSVSVEITHVTTTTTITSTAGSTVMEQFRVMGVPAVREEVGGLKDNPGVGTAITEQNSN